MPKRKAAQGLSCSKGGDFSNKKAKYERKRLSPNMGCSLGRFVGAVGQLNDTQRQWVTNMGFQSLLDLQFSRLDRNFCMWVFEGLDANTKKLKIRDDFYAEIDAEKLYYVMGIPSKLGNDVEETDDRNKVSELKKLYTVDPEISLDGESGLVLEEKTERGIRPDWVLNLMLKEKTDERKFKKHFLLYALGAVLCPVQGGYISSRLVRVLWHAEHAKKLDWAKFVLDWLLDRSKKYTNIREKKKNKGKERKPKGIGGCIIFLMLFYLDRLDRDPVNWNGEARIQCWRDKSIAAAIEADRFEKGHYGKCEVLKDVEYGERHPLQPKKLPWEDELMRQKLLHNKPDSAHQCSTVECEASNEIKAEFANRNWKISQVRRERNFWRLKRQAKSFGDIGESKHDGDHNEVEGHMKDYKGRYVRRTRGNLNGVDCGKG